MSKHIHFLRRLIKKRALQDGRLLDVQPADADAPQERTPTSAERDPSWPDAREGTVTLD
jgi:hypothetical protein